MSKRLWFRLVLMSLQVAGCAHAAPATATPKLAPALAHVVPAVSVAAKPATQQQWAVMEDLEN
jgi:hypothetical protein